MTSLFGNPSGTIRKSTTAANNSISSGLNKASGILSNAYSSLVPVPGPTSLSGGGLNISSNGKGIDLTQSNSVKNAIANLNSGLTTDTNAYNGLLSQLHPGFGAITQARRNAINNQYQKNFGDLQSQLQSRRIAGSSFANSQLSNLQAQQAQDLAAADAQSFEDELNATTQLIQQRTNARTTAITDALSQANFETGVGASLLSQFQQSAQNTQSLMTDLAKTNAALTVSAKTGIANNQITSGTNIANIQGQEAAGFGQLVGTIGGLALGGPFGGSLGNSLFGSSAAAA